MGTSKTKIMEELDELGVTYDKKATAYELKALYDEELAKRDAESVATTEADNAIRQDVPEANEPIDNEADQIVEETNCGEGHIETVEAIVTCAQLALRSKPWKPAEGEEDNLLAILGEKSMVFVAVGGDEEWACIPALNGYVMRKFLALA